MTEKAIFKYATLPARPKRRPVYSAFQCSDDAELYRCPSVASWPMGRQQLERWGAGADVEIKFYDHPRETGN